MSMSIITAPPLSRYRFKGSGAGKTATVALFDRNYAIVALKTLTIGTTATQINDNSADILGGNFDPNWTGMMVYGTPDSTIYALASNDTTDPSTGTQAVTGGSAVSPAVEVSSSAPSVALTSGMWFGDVPQWVKDAYAATAGGSANAANQVAEGVLIGAVTETPAATTTTSSGLNGLLRMIGNFLGALTETAPATDTASSGLNGRLQRIAQRLTSIIGLASGASTTTTPTMADATSVTILASNANRKSLFVQNNSSANIMINTEAGVLTGIVPTSTNIGIVIPPGGSFSSGAVCPTGAITGYQSSGGSINTVVVVSI